MLLFLFAIFSNDLIGGESLMNILLTILKVYLLIGVISLAIAIGLMLLTLLATCAVLLFIHRDPVYLEEEKQEDWAFVHNMIERIKPNSISECIEIYIVNGILLWPREIYVGIKYCIKGFKTSFNKRA